MKDKSPHINLIIQACRKGNRSGQRKLYQLFFAYAMSIALRYTANRAEAEDVLNESLLKTFTKLDQTAGKLLQNQDCINSERY